MARVTVEDCIEKLPNRFELVMIAAQRARRIGTGAPLTLDRDNDKNPVVALREIAETTVDINDLREDLIRGKQRIIALDDDSEDVIDSMDGEQEWSILAAQKGDADLAGADDADDDMDDEDEGGLEDLAGADYADDVE